jgi:hypothetical protein
MAGMNLENCFIDEQANYNYEIKTPEGEYLASARSLSVLDTGAINQEAFKLARNPDGSIIVDKGGLPSYDINVHVWTVQTIKHALTKWRWQNREISTENIALLPEDIRNHLFKEIRKHEGFFENNKEAIEKN